MTFGLIAAALVFISLALLLLGRGERAVLEFTYKQAGPFMFHAHQSEFTELGWMGMFDVVDQYETGQEYMSRYQAVDPGADAYGWENRIRLKGIDVTVYAIGASGPAPSDTR